MRLDRAQLYAQPVGNLLVEQALGHQPQHFVLMCGQAGQACGQVGIPAERRYPRHRLAQQRRDPAFALQHGLQRGLQLVQTRALGQVARGAEVDGAPDHLRLLVGGDDDDRQARLQRTDGRQPGQPMVARHVQVQQHQVDRLVLDRLQHAVQ